MPLFAVFSAVTMLQICWQIISEDPLIYFNLTAQYYNKHWIKYMHKFIENFFTNNYYTSGYLVSNILQIMQYNIRIKYILKQYSVKLIHDIKYLKHNVTHILYRFKAYGQILHNIYAPNNTIFCLNAPWCYLHRVWHFELTEELRIRLVITRLKIHEIYGSCKQNVTIESGVTLITNAFLFRGDYSKCYYYLTEKQLYFNLFYGSIPYLKLDVTFDIVSAHIVENCFTGIKITIQIIYNIKIIYTLLYIYYIKVSKYEQLHLKVQNVSEKVVIFDGPGYLSKSKTTSGKMSTFVSLTFQCLLRFQSHDFKIYQTNSLVKYNGYPRYTTRVMFNMETYMIAYDDLQSPVQHPVALLITFPNNTSIHITISTFYFHDVDDDINCKYGGVSFSDLTNSLMHETTTVCTNSVDDQQNLQLYYSDQTKTIIVMYSYPEYGMLSSLLHMSISQCHAVKINICALKLACEESSKLCSTFWRNKPVKVRVCKEMDIILKTQLRDQECSIVQILNNPLHNFSFPDILEGVVYKHSCSIKLYAEDLVNSLYEYNIFGCYVVWDTYPNAQKLFLSGVPHKFSPIVDRNFSKWVNFTKENHTSIYFSGKHLVSNFET